MTRRGALLATGATAVVGVLSVLVVSELTTDPSTTAGSASTAVERADTGSGSRAEGSEGVGRGGEQRAGEARASGERSAAKARRAAIDYVTAPQRWLYLDDVELREAVAAITAPNAEARLVEEVAGEISVAREALGQASGPVWWLVRPLASRVETFEATQAEVSVWAVTVLSAAGVAVPQADWMTITLRLVWDEGVWLVDRVDERLGPTPVVGPRDEPWQPEAFDDALEGFERVGNGGPQ